MYGSVVYNALIGDSYTVTDSSVAALSQNDKKRNPVMLSAAKHLIGVGGIGVINKRTRV